jgi:hypothetical protein
MKVGIRPATHVGRGFYVFWGWATVLSCSSVIRRILLRLLGLQFIALCIMQFVPALPDRFKDELRYGGSFRGHPRQHSREDSPNRSLFIELFKNIGHAACGFCQKRPKASPRRSVTHVLLEIADAAHDIFRIPRGLPSFTTLLYIFFLWPLVRELNRREHIFARTPLSGGILSRLITRRAII